MKTITLALLPKEKQMLKPFVAASTVWLFHLTAIAGVTLGYKDWFIDKTPINLIVQLLLLIATFPLLNRKSISLFGFLAFLGFVVEYIGVATGFPFGTYFYGENLGFKLLNIPVLIAINWAVLVFCTSSIVSSISTSKWIKALTGSSLMLILDFFMELVAPELNFWSFSSEVPVQNYISWFAISFIMHLLVDLAKVKGNTLFSINLYLSQLVFFIYFATLA